MTEQEITNKIDYQKITENIIGKEGLIWSEIADFQVIDCMKEAVSQAIEITLRKAAENVKILQTISNPMTGNSKQKVVTYIVGNYHDMDLSASIDKDSILNLKNKLKEQLL